MAIAAEYLYESCTCDGGMRNGRRCADCNGRGIVAKGTTPKGEAVPAPESETTDDGLDDMSITHLRSRAKDLGLSAGGGKATLVKAIREATAEAPEAEVNPDHDEGEPDDEPEAEA